MIVRWVDEGGKVVDPKEEQELASLLKQHADYEEKSLKQAENEGWKNDFLRIFHLKTNIDSIKECQKEREQFAEQALTDLQHGLDEAMAKIREWVIKK